MKRMMYITPVAVQETARIAMKIGSRMLYRSFLYIGAENDKYEDENSVSCLKDCNPEGLTPVVM